MRFGIVSLAYFTASVRSRGIEISERHILKTVSLVVVLHKLLHHQLGLTVNAGGLLRTVLRDKSVAAIPVSSRG